MQITSEGAFWPCEGVHGARGHAGWALGRIGTGEALRALREREGVEEDQWVREEISLAI